MPLKIVHNDITKMQCEAIVNTANDHPTVGSGCDLAIYTAAGYDLLLDYRRENIGFIPEGDAFITPAFNLSAKYIIHAVSPHFYDGKSGEEKLLRSCYSKSLNLAYENNVKSIAFPLISTGSFGYPKEEGLRIAVDEINAFLMHHDMLIYIVVFGAKATALGKSIYPGLESYIDHNYVSKKHEEEYGYRYLSSPLSRHDELDMTSSPGPKTSPASFSEVSTSYDAFTIDQAEEDFACNICKKLPEGIGLPEKSLPDIVQTTDFYEVHESKLSERIDHMSDTFSEYLLFLIQDKGMTNADVYNRAIVDKRVFSKIKKEPDYHPKKITAMCLCIGAMLSLDEARDLLARAGYALSPCDKTDIIFSYFIENKIYDMIELDIQLEEHGLKCLIE